MARDTSFYYSFLVLPAEQRRAIVAVWDFCRAVDDAVDEAAEADDRGREVIDVARRGGALLRRRRPADAAGARAASRSSPRSTCRAQPFEDLIEGVEMDLHRARYDDVRRTDRVLPPRRVGRRPDVRRDLRLPRFARRASTRSISASRCSSPTSCATCKADLQHGRIYLPHEDLARFGVTEAALRRRDA